MPAPDALCADTAGDWDECFTSSCFECDDCIAGCGCPTGTIWSFDFGCQDAPSEEALCTASGGVWNECASASCEGCLDCIGECGCAENATWQEGAGCQETNPAPPLRAECEANGGTYNECGRGSCPACTDCIATCTPADGGTDPEPSGRDQPTSNSAQSSSAGQRIPPGCSAVGEPGAPAGAALWVLLACLALVWRHRSPAPAR